MKKVFYVLFALFIIMFNNLYGVAYYDIHDVFPGEVPNPLVLDYTHCVSKYGFCSCRITGIKDKERILDLFDSNGDGILSKPEIASAIKGGFIQKNQLGDVNFLACWFDPPYPGPYQEQECKEIFGEDDCLCLHKHPEGAYCYSKSAVEVAQYPVQVTRDFCNKPEGTCPTPTGEGCFDCYCPKSETSNAMGFSTMDTCFVKTKNPDPMECFDEVRIFSGKDYDCTMKVKCAGITAPYVPNCCPDHIKCGLREYSQRFNVASFYTFANMGFHLYVAYKGYSAYAGTLSSVSGFIKSIETGVVPLDPLKSPMFDINPYSTSPITSSSILSNPTGYIASKIPGLDTLFGNYHNLIQAGLLNNPTLQTLYTITSYVGYVQFAISVYKQLICLAGWCCHPEDYELACKVRSRLCLYAGDFKTGHICKKYKQSWMCFNSQIARVINEYGLPQIYAHNCHEENCDGASVSPDRHSVNPTNCGCKCAYAENCKPRHPRFRGFSIDQFQRLNFSEIPIDKEIIRLMAANDPNFRSMLAQNGNVLPEDTSQIWGSQDYELTQPAGFDIETSQSSIEESKEEAKENVLTETTAATPLGDCSNVFPLPHGESFTQFYSLPEGSKGVVRICTKVPQGVKTPRIQYVFFNYYSTYCEGCINCAYQGIKPKSCSDCPTTGGCNNFLFSQDMASWWQNAEAYETVPWAIYYKKTVNIASFVNAFYVDNFLYFYQKNIFPFSNFSLSDFPFHEDSSILDTYRDAALIDGLANSDFIIVLTFSLSQQGMNRAKALLYQLVSGFVLKDKLMEKKPTPCLPEECKNILAGKTSIEFVSAECYNWYNWMKNTVYMSLDADCQVYPEGFDGYSIGISGADATDYGAEWLAVKNVGNLQNVGLIENKDYFTRCPDYQTDICLAEKRITPEMVCPRPSRVNIAQRIVIYGGNDGRQKYQSYVNGIYKTRYCWIDNAVADSCPCQ